eukprot:gene14390-14493_t
MSCPAGSSSPQGAKSEAECVDNPITPGLSQYDYLWLGVTEMLSLGSADTSIVKNWDFNELDPCNGTSYAGVTCDESGSIIGIEEIGNDARIASFPRSFGGLISLRALDISNTGISGTFPAAWQSLTNMQTLVMDNNKISGSLPEYLSTWTGLTTLSLGSNNLRGPLLESLGTNAVSNSLVNLNLGANQLEGPVPDSYANLSAIKTVRLAGNVNLTGCVPGDWNGKVNTGDEVALQNIIEGTGIDGFCPLP